MKRAIKQAEKTNKPSPKKPASKIKKAGYNEKHFDAEEQASYNKSDEAKGNAKNTAAPDS